MSPAFALHSPETATDYRIYTHADKARQEPSPVVLFMDGDDQFAAALEAYRGLRGQQRVPPLLLVGVGYGASYTRPANRRGRDYTPVPHADEPTSGGANRFLSFLTQTLWPELARRHPVDAARRGIAGHSLGSLLVLHALFQPQPFFTHHLASAPSIWWAERAILTQIRKLRHRQGDLNGQLFLAVGENDTASMTCDFRLLERQLADEPFTGLRVTAQWLAQRDHYNAIPDSFSAGLLALFG